MRQGKGIFTIVPTPTPILVNWKEYNDTNNQYAIKYPQTITPSIDPSGQDTVTTFLYTQDNNEYSIQILPPGSGISGIQGYAVPNATTDQKTVYYGGRKFKRITWYDSTKKPFLISVVPDEEGFVFSSFQIHLPVNNAQQYITIFDQMLSTLKIPQ